MIISLFFPLVMIFPTLHATRHNANNGPRAHSHNLASPVSQPTWAQVLECNHGRGNPAAAKRLLRQAVGGTIPTKEYPPMQEHIDDFLLAGSDKRPPPFLPIFAVAAKAERELESTGAAEGVRHGDGTGYAFPMMVERTPWTDLFLMMLERASARYGVTFPTKCHYSPPHLSLC